MAVLERAGEERARAGAPPPASRGSRRSRRSRRGRRPAAAPRAGRGRPCCRGASRSRRRSARRRRGTRPGARALPSSGQPLVRVARVRRIVPRLVEQAGERLLARPRAPLVDVDARAAPRAPGRRDRRRPPAPRGCGRSRRRPPPPRASASRPHADSAALPRIEYSSSEPCALTAKRAPAAAPTGPPSRTWFAKTRSAGRCSRSAAAFRSTQRVELGPGAVLDELDLVALVAVEHEDRQQPADVRPHRRGAAEVVEPRLGLLAEDGDLVPRPRPLPRQRPRVDVRARAAEEVAVPEQDLHGRPSSRSV